MSKPNAATLAKAGADKAAMENKISVAAAVLAVNAPGLAKSKGKTYETWVMFEIAARLKVSHKVVARNSAGNPTKSFRVRGGPGHIKAAKEPSGKLPCYFEIPSIGPWGNFELHNSVEHVGVSDETHELDISVISKRYADAQRKKPSGGAYQGPCLLGAELKAFDDKTTLDKVIARSVVGATVDLQPLSVLKSITIELRARPAKPIVETFHHLQMSLITTAQITNETTKYLTAYGIDAWDDVAPSHDEKPLGTLVTRIKPWL